MFNKNVRKNLNKSIDIPLGILTRNIHPGVLPLLGCLLFTEKWSVVVSFAEISTKGVFPLSTITHPLILSE